ncbi:MAG TPA: MoaD/ThiS family protein [Bryobacteraceae bacterium]|nr:MoaD/ThiS family protein [Bryobacteraceae bacterium]
MKVYVPGPLRSYTGNSAVVEAEGATLEGLLEALDRTCPGIRFRMIDEQDGIRPHIRFFVNTEPAPRLDTPLGSGDEVHIICALSGG